MGLGEELGCRLRKKGKTIAVAESMTGGLVASLITDVPGSSDYFVGGVVAYSNEMKTKLLGVKPSTLEKFGAVSEQTAMEMAKGVREITGAGIGSSLTGIAGPGGGTDKKPVGLVYCAVDLGDDIGEVRKAIIEGNRLEVKRRAAELLIRMVIECLERIG
ncbi:MAG: nicotinamide-nucleotide amidohydrolase family protein [Methanomassiliicoccales archaeon]|jgi:PncC family amidohydrolase|nr:nicotinamide-nucleotide amidohydrolase family protein [Methanomassiliicoccales archaeon]